MIRCVNLVAVVCDGEACQETVVLKRWQDASKLGWAAPIDGGFQLCPKCSEKRTEKLFNDARMAEIVKKCPLVS